MVLAQIPKRPHTIHDKKRHGQHHKHSKHYTRPYWPYLPLLLVASLGLIGNLVWSQHQQVLGARSNITASSLLNETNTVRGAKQEAALSLNSSLNRAAQSKANDMVKRNYWSHNAPGGKTPWNFMEQSGYSYLVAGENLAYGFSSPAETVHAWMNSPAHRANVLGESFSQAGFGIATAPNYQGQGAQTVVVALYAQPITPNADRSVLGETFAAPPHSIARIQLLTGASWSLLLVSFIAGISIAIFVIRHGVFLHRVLVKSETFALKHRTFDLVLVIAIVGGFLLTRASGFIQ